MAAKSRKRASGTRHLPTSAPADERIIERLNLILRVLAIQVGAGRSITERIQLLKLAGLDNATIADVLRTTPGTVRTLGANLRRRDLISD